MALDLQKLALHRLLDNKNQDFYSKLSPVYFTGVNGVLFNRIQDFYKTNIRIPTIDEFSVLKKEISLQDYLETQILSEDNKYDLVGDEFLIGQLQDYFIREETINFLDKFIDDLSDLEKVEIIDKLQSHLLKLNKAIPMIDELYDVADLDFFPSSDDFTLFPSGLSSEYDSINGGLALQELVLLGGRRGSGKSIISLNIAINRYLQGNTVAFFTIEMRYKEVYDRLLSILSGVPFLTIFKNEVSIDQKLQLVRAKIDNFYEPSDKINEWYNELHNRKDFKKFENRIKTEKPSFKTNRFFIIDDESLTINRIDHYCNMFSNQHKKFNLAVVDYINIIKHEDSKDWKTQIVLAEALKGISRKFNITMLSPYQIDATGEARFAKGILDAADRSFTFFPAIEGENREQGNKLQMMTSKIRNGKHMSFDVYMDWACVKIDPAQSNIISEKPHKIAMYGDDESSKKSEVSKDL
jgi:replicative DNA helicase